MKTRSFWETAGVSAIKSSILLRFGMALCAIISMILIWLVSSAELPAARTAHAATAMDQVGTSTLPWGLALDGANHLWVAEPGCDPSPAVCSNPSSGGVISEYDPTTLNKIHDFIPPATYNPFFLTVDPASNIWFSDPSHGAIGELVPGTGTWSEFQPLAGATPWDLTFDRNGHLWFTNFIQGTIGEFTPQGNQLVGNTSTPTPGSLVYGITLAADGSVWFAENNKPFVGSFSPPASGALPQNAINEHWVPTSQQHSITGDGAGNIWFSTGFDGKIGEIPQGSSTAQMFCVPTAQQGIHLSGIAVDSTGKVWFTDSVGSRIGYMDPTQASSSCSTHSSNGFVITTLTSNAHPHDGLLVDPQNNVFFTEEFARQLGKIPANSLTTVPPTATPTSGVVNTGGTGPVATNWYFAEGRAGGGFNEFLTMGNPDRTHPCVVDLHYFPEGSTAVNKEITIQPASRWTESVTSDLGTTINGPGISVAAFAQNAASSPCAGITAERPMYFNFRGVQSGSDVVGATQTSTQFYFTDIPVRAGYSSFLTVLNPPGGQPATVTVTYYAAGSKLGTQSLTVNSGARGTINPSSLPQLPQHSAAVVTSTAPIVAERPTYFLNISGGVAGTITGASSLIGSRQLASEWFLAEGYTGNNASGGITQENLLISNLDPLAHGTANLIIKLEYPDGSIRPFPASVAHQSQLIWDVNAHAVGAPAKEVSVDIVATGASVVVERQMFFQYAHTINGNTLHSTGGSEVTGQVGMYKAYNFAEGYSNTGYHEWLTLQNPTINSEAIQLTMVNGYGRVYTTTFSVNHNTRFTQDITALVLATMVQPGDDHRGYEVSLTVQTLDGSLFVAERPMYWNTAGSSLPTQGGSDTFGYAGT